jgi:predicted ester cyclase
MEELMLEKKISATQQNMLNYFETHDVKYIAEDAIFKNMGTGEVHTGREEIAGMLHYIYHVAFDARAEMFNKIITEDKAVVEGLFKGKHINEFAGIPATNKEVSVPLCVTYELEKGLIKEARIYMLVGILISQLTQ